MFGGFFRHLPQWLDLFDLLVFENLGQSSGIVGDLRKSSEIIWICRKMAENLLTYWTKQYWPFWSRFLRLLPGKIYCFKVLQSQNSEVFSVIEVPPFKPSLRDSLNNCQTSRGLSVCVLTEKKKKDFIATIECGKIRQKPGYTVNEVPLTKNSLRAPFVARNNSLLRLHWRPTLCGSKKQNKNAR